MIRTVGLSQRPSAEAIIQHVCHAASTRSPISDDVAMAFGGGFYSRLGNGRDVAAAIGVSCSTRGERSAHAVGKQGALVLKVPPDEDRRYITVEPFGRVKQKVYASLWFTPHFPAGVEDLAESDGATFIDIRSKTPGNIPLDADWLTAAREVNTVLLDLQAAGCSELHLFPSIPITLAMAIGMGLDTKRKVVVHQWYDDAYQEVLRLNELARHD